MPYKTAVPAPKFATRHRIRAMKSLLACSLFLLAVPARADDAQKLLSGVLLDANGRVPLPEFTLEIQAGAHLERVTTDASGRFTSGMPFAPGTLAIRPIDSESTERVPLLGGLEQPSAAPAELAVEWKGTPLEVVVPCGPTFDLTWKALADEANPPAVPASVARLVSTSPGAIDEGVALRATVRTAADGRTWVRFAALPATPFAKPFGTRLEIVTRDGFWMSTAEVSTTDAKEARAVALEWKPCSRWTGTLRDPKGRTVPRTWMTLTRTSEEGAILERKRTCCDGQGSYRFTGLVPGIWTLRGHPLRFAEFASEKRTLEPRTDSKLSLALDPERKLTALQGRALGATVVEGAPAPLPARIVLRRAGEVLPLETIELAWAIDAGRYAAPFTIPALPMFDYELQLIPPAGDEAAWEARALQAKPGPDPVTFLRR